MPPRALAWLRSQTAGIHLWKQWLHLLCFICSLWGASNLLYMTIIIFIGFSYLVIFSAGLSGDDFVLFDWLEPCLFTNVLVKFQHCTQVKFTNLVGNPARWVCFFIKADFEKISPVEPLQWMGAIRMGLLVIVMSLSAVWTLLPTAPIHCRGSIDEQKM